MIFGVATNEDRRQRSVKPKQRSLADLIYKASLNVGEGLLFVIVNPIKNFGIF